MRGVYRYIQVYGRMGKSPNFLILNMICVPHTLTFYFFDVLALGFAGRAER